MSSLASGYRDCLEAAPGCKMISIDFAGIEAVMSGWFANDPAYMRLATLGVHSYIASNYVHDFVDPQIEAASLEWPDEKLDEYFQWIKAEYPKPYKANKIVVHSSAYGATPYGIYKNQPEVFGSIKNAEAIQQYFFRVAPLIKKYQDETIVHAARDHFIGGTSGPTKHPYGYKFYFYDVIKYEAQASEADANRLRKLGIEIVYFQKKPFAKLLSNDAKPAIGCRPQSTAGGKLKKTTVRLTKPGMPNYIGDAFYGRTPIRAYVHDEYWLEVPDASVDEVIRKTVAEMTAPIEEMPCPEEWGIGPYVRLGVSVKVGRNLGDCKPHNPGGLVDVTKDYYRKTGKLAGDVYREGEEEEDAA